MAMKKKFLGLALAITMALPMGTAFADPIRADHDLWCTGAGAG